MSNSEKKTLPTIGFLTVIEHSDHGLFGGYLILNVNGRPLEFHCTAPVKSNRAQEILYGASLKPFLYGEQIGHTLFTKGRVEPTVVCTDVEPVLSLRELVSVPVVLVQSQNASREKHSLKSFALGRNQMAVSANFAADVEKVIEFWKPYDANLELLEPFSRIRDAIEEAQRSARPAA